jgi:putative tryptophan/tyrosine transport system substrate-binding protein
VIRRREFMTLLGGGAAAAWSVRASAQKPPTIGFLGPASASAMSAWTAAFVNRLRELGWMEGRTISIEYRWADGRADRVAELAAELVRLNASVIVTTGTGVPALKQATSVIPIVFTIASDPIASGLVTSLSRPGGNVTGLSQLAADLGGKRLDILRDVVPSLRRLAILYNAGNAATSAERAQVEQAARTLSLEVLNSEIRRAEDIAPAIEALKGRVDAIYVQRTR